jgi:hypothetical protein
MIPLMITRMRWSSTNDESFDGLPLSMESCEKIPRFLDTCIAREITATQKPFGGELFLTISKNRML